MGGVECVGWSEDTGPVTFGEPIVVEVSMRGVIMGIVERPDSRWIHLHETSGNTARCWSSRASCMEIPLKRSSPIAGGLTPGMELDIKGTIGA